MELKTMSSEQLEERLSEIRGLLDSPEADLDSLDAEVRSINEELEKEVRNRKKGPQSSTRFPRARANP